MTAPDSPYAPYRRTDGGIFRPPRAVAHRGDEFDPHSFEVLRNMQERHFWYRGRHRFLFRFLRRRAAPALLRGDAVDLGGGTGGWVRYLRTEAPDVFATVALADSSERALDEAAPIVGAETPRFQVDLMDLQWSARWDVAFLLDVIEHIPDDQTVMRQVRDALRPGGLAIVATPALDAFWSYNDEIVYHVRRYSRARYRALAEASGLELVAARYYMFFLSPLMLLRRFSSVDPKTLTEEDRRALFRRTHAVPSRPVNALLGAIFSAETPLGHWIPFPWGTSIAGAFRRPG